MKLRIATILFCVAVLAGELAVLQLWYFRADYRGWLKGADYLETEQIRRHQAVLDHTAQNPWRYRVLSDWGAEMILAGGRTLGAPVTFRRAMIGLRLAANAAMLAALAWWLLDLGLGFGTVLLGLILASYSVSWSYWNSGLTVSSPLDAAAFLAGAALCHRQKWALLPWLMLPAALNRESAGLIALFPLVVGGWRRDTLKCSAASLAIYGAIFAGLRVAYGWPPRASIGDPWLEQLAQNLLEFAGPWHLSCISLLPLAAALGWRTAPAPLRRLALLVVPVWIVGLSALIPIREPRNYLPPLMLIFVPLALFAVKRGSDNQVGYSQ